jgi:hypothetical protein
LLSCLSEPLVTLIAQMTLIGIDLISVICAISGSDNGKLVTDDFARLEEHD